jgi:hypothetical protein
VHRFSRYCCIAAAAASATATASAALQTCALNASTNLCWLQPPLIPEALQEWPNTILPAVAAGFLYGMTNKWGDELKLLGWHAWLQAGSSFGVSWVTPADRSCCRPSDYCQQTGAASVPCQ